MEGKLIKVDDVYRLVEETKHGNSIIGTTDLDYQKSWSDRCQKLSIKNCQAIERDYDLDELAKIYSGKEIFEDGYDGLINPHTKMFIEVAYIKGFQKALEILGDKKFSERQVRKAITQARLCVEDDDSGIKFLNEDRDIVESLQQTEWDVEIVMGTHCKQIDHLEDGKYLGSSILRLGEAPMLDSEGCLILKRK